MNVKLIVSASAIILGAMGLILTFAPEILLNDLKMEINPASGILVQLIGGLYFGYSMLNWMTKDNLLGGIYGRPITIANFAHFFIAGLAIGKKLFSNSDFSMVIWTVGVVYLFFGCLYAIILFRHPMPSKKIESI